MKWLACLVVMALALPCAASDPGRVSGQATKPAARRSYTEVARGFIKPPAAEPLVSGRLVRTVLRPDLEAARRAMAYIYWQQFIRRARMKPVDLDRPIRAAHFGR
jgi:hypothetical protein